VESVESVLANSTVKHYKVTITTHNPNFISSLESLWGFGSVKIHPDLIRAEYIVRPEEIENFCQRISKLTLSELRTVARI
jgi:hypothetical protein